VTRWSDTVKQLESCKAAMESTWIRKDNLEEVSEDMLHSEPVAEFMGAICGKIDGWIMALKVSTLALDAGVDGKPEELLEDKEKIRLVEHAQELARQVERACHIVNAQSPRVVESAHPIEDAQEDELSRYDAQLSRSLLKGSGDLSTVTKSMWAEAETSLNSLELYVKEHKVRADQIRKSDITGTIMILLKSLESLDQVGVDRTKVDVDQVERVWGLVDKIGSGLHYLLHVDKNRSSSDPVSDHLSPSFVLMSDDIF
jgi:hypothetical protein